MATYNMFVGSNNVTHKVELDKLTNILDEYLDGYTITNAKGVWQGTHEDSVIVTIANISDQWVRLIAKNVRVNLDQNAVAIQLVNNLEFI
jgi:hypothetical protein